MSEPTKYDDNFLDVNAKEEWLKNKSKDDINLSFNCYSSLDDVKENLKMYSQNKNLDDVKLIMGKVEETLSINSNLPNEITILRLDTDWYESTKIELDILYPKLVNGGVLIIDDYGHWKGARKAVDEYFFGKKVIKNFIDYSCRMIIK